MTVIVILTNKAVDRIPLPLSSHQSRPCSAAILRIEMALSMFIVGLNFGIEPQSLLELSKREKSTRY